MSVTDQERRKSVGADALSAAVIEAIAEHQGVDPLSLEPPLYHAVDPDALDALFPPDRTADEAAVGFVVFPYNGCDVYVSRSGDVRISDPADP